MKRSRSCRIGLLAVLAAACSSPTQQSASSVVDVAGEGRVLFFAQNAIPNSFMDALFVGRVVADGDGCLRLDGPDPATVVWPFRFSLDGQGRVLDSLGGEIGRIGESFSLGGGEVVLHDGIAMSQEDKQRAEARCPGRFWIVGDVL